MDAKNKFDALGEPKLNNHMDYTIELEYIYSTLASCTQVLIGEKMDDILSNYTVNK